MPHTALHPDVITYNDVISAYEKGPLSQRALELYQTMLHQGLLLNVFTYNALISACKRGVCRREPCSSWRRCCTKASIQT